MYPPQFYLFLPQLSRDRVQRTAITMDGVMVSVIRIEVQVAEAQGQPNQVRRPQACQLLIKNLQKAPPILKHLVGYLLRSLWLHRNQGKRSRVLVRYRQSSGNRDLQLPERGCRRSCLNRFRNKYSPVPHQCRLPRRNRRRHSQEWACQL